MNVANFLIQLQYGLFQGRHVVGQLLAAQTALQGAVQIEAQILRHGRAAVPVKEAAKIGCQHIFVFHIVAVALDAAHTDVEASDGAFQAVPIEGDIVGYDVGMAASSIEPKEASCVVGKAAAVDDTSRKEADPHHERRSHGALLFVWDCSGCQKKPREASNKRASK